MDFDPEVIRFLAGICGDGIGNLVVRIKCELNITRYGVLWNGTPFVPTSC